jgi:hypothetical protein
MGAGSKFEIPLTLLRDGDAVMACGPLGFDPADTHAEVSIHLVQPGHAQGRKTDTIGNVRHGGNSGGFEDDEAAEWMFTIEAAHLVMTSALRAGGMPPARFVSGVPVKGFGLITYHQAGAAQPPKHWSDPNLNVV